MRYDKRLTGTSARAIGAIHPMSPAPPASLPGCWAESAKPRWTWTGASEDLRPSHPGLLRYRDTIPGPFLTSGARETRMSQNCDSICRGPEVLALILVGVLGPNRASCNLVGRKGLC